MALSFALSWYQGIALDQLATPQAGAEEDLAWHAILLAVCSSDIASFTPFDELVREQAADGVEIPEDTYRLAFNDPDGSSSETNDDEETGSSTRAYADIAPGAEVDTGATAEPAQPGADAPTA